MPASGNLWPPFLRNLNRGREALRYEKKVLPRIAEWSWPFWNEAPQTMPVHVLAGSRNWPLTAWMLASWFHFTEHAWPIVVHDDGTLPDEARALYKKLFPAARLIGRREADASVDHLLRSYPFCADYRKQHPRALKLFDVLHFTAGARFCIFDSELLFFNYPREILEWVKGDADECWFHEDVKESSLLTAAEARSELGIKIWSRVHSGLCLLTKSAIDLDLCDRALAQTSLLSDQTGRIEQTLLMLCAAHHGKGGLLPRTYEVSLAGNAADEGVSRFYVDAVRDRFFSEGVKHLEAIFFPREKER